MLKYFLILMMSFTSAFAQDMSIEYTGNIYIDDVPANGSYNLTYALFNKDNQISKYYYIDNVFVKNSQITIPMSFDFDTLSQTNKDTVVRLGYSKISEKTFTELSPDQTLIETICRSADINKFPPPILTSNYKCIIPQNPENLTWSDIPLTYPEPGTQRRADFDKIWNESRTRTVRFCVIGDSQETLGANGDIYIHHLQAALGLLYGNVPETGFNGPGSSGGGSPAAEYVEESDANSQPHGMDPTLFPPFITPTYHDGNLYGSLFLLQHDQIHSRRLAGLVNTSLFDTTGQIGIQLIVMERMVSSGQAQVFVCPQDNPNSSYFSPVVTIPQSNDANLASGGTIQPILLTFNDLPYNNKKYQQVFVRSSNSDGIVIVGARYKNYSRPWGIAVSSFSAGGYTANRFMTNHGNCGPILHTLNNDIYMISFGINDCFSLGRTAQQFKTDIQQIITLLRQSTPGCRVILRVEAYWPDHYNSEYEQYAQVEKELVDENSNMLLLNHRKAMTLLGHNDANESDAGLTNRGEWSANTSYSINDYVSQSNNGTYIRYWKCTQSHVSGSSYSVDGPGTNYGHYKWIPWRWLGISNVDSGHFSDYGQQKQAWIDTLLLIGGSGVTPCYGVIGN